jgi:uncharacterized damage-inducible protein DinB
MAGSCSLMAGYRSLHPGRTKIETYALRRLTLAAMNGIAFSELLAWREEETARWKDFFTHNASCLEIPCSIAGTKDVRELVQHIFAVELRFAERLNDIAEVTSYESMRIASVEDLFLHGEKASSLLRHFLETRASDGEWARVLEFQTRSAGLLRASKRKIFAHALMHGVRHWAQLATELRQQGIKTDWAHDFLFSRTMD